MNDLQPGKELDAEVAEKVMGCKPSKPQPEYDYWYCECRNKAHSAKFNDGHATINFIKSYSTDISDAFDVVKRFTEQGHNFDLSRLSRPGGEFWSAVFSHEKHMLSFPRAEGETAAHAICKAALKAVEK